MVHCREVVDYPVGYHRIPREDGVGFNMYALGEKRGGISQEERRLKQQERQIERKRQEEEKRRGALPVAERDAAFRKLRKYSGLAPKHHADLIDRGLSKDQIEKLQFFTIQPGKRVPFGVPENFPGVRWWRLSSKEEGYACPAFDPEGRITGYQIRVDNSEAGGKYRWASGVCSSHLPNGELPITFVRPLDGLIRRQEIGISEGILKPAIAAQILGQIFIGAPSLRFSKNGEIDGKPAKVILEQLVQYLKVASEELGTKNVTIYPDGAVVRNPQLYPLYEWLCKALRELGYNVRIAWWWQINKNHLDCDELPEGQEIKLLNWETFADIAKKFGGADSSWMQKVRRDWKKKRGFSVEPANTTRDRFVDWKCPSDNASFFGRSPLGTGKTTLLKRWVKQLRDRGVTRFFVLGYRNTLLLQTAANFPGFMHIHDGDALLLRSDEYTSFCLCVDSLLRFNPEDFKDTVIFLDELAAVIRHLLHSPTIPAWKRDRILRLFEEALRNARLIICMDGFLADWAVDYVALIAPGKKIERAQNIYNENKPHINFLIGTTDFDEKIKANDRSPLLRLMWSEAPMPVICSDNQVFIEGLDEIFQSNDAKTLRIDSKTVCEDYVKEFLENPNKYLRDNEIEVLLYSPSAESGLDVSIENYFSHQFCFFFNIIGVDAAIQMMGRVRDPGIERFMWCKEGVAISEREHSISPFVEDLAKTWAYLFQQATAQSLKKLSSERPSEAEIFEEVNQLMQVFHRNSIDCHFETSVIIKSIENAEKMNFRSFTREALLSEGYRVTELIPSPDFDAKEMEKEAKERVKRQNCSDIFNAPVADEEIESLARGTLQFDSRWSERCRKMKAGYLYQLPGIRESGVWDEALIYLMEYEEPEFLERQKLFYLLENPEEADEEAFRQLHWMARQEKSFIGNIKSRFLKIQAYLQLDIKRFFDLDARWTDSSPELQDLLQRCKNPAIAKILSHPGKLSPIKNLTRLLKPLGIFLRGEKSRHEGKIVRIYRVDSEQFFKPARLAVLKAVAERYEKIKLSREELNWDNVLQHEIISSEAEFEFAPEVAETTQNRSFAVARVPNLYINNGSRATLEEDDEATSGVTELEGTAPFLSQLSCDNSQNLVYSPDTTAHDPVNVINNGSSAVIPELYGDDTRPLEMRLWTEDYKVGDKVLAYFPQSRSWKEATVASIRGGEIRVESGFLGLEHNRPDLIAPLAPSLLVEESPKVPSPLPSEKIAVGPSNGISRLATSTLRIAAIAAAALASSAVALASPAAASPSPLEVSATSHQIPANAQEITVQPTPAPASNPVEQKPQPAIKIDSRVRYLGKGSIRYGMVGTVTAIVGRKVKVRLDYHPSLTGDWRNLEDAFPYFELVE
jgi:hypothetical protein